MTQRFAHRLSAVNSATPAPFLVLAALALLGLTGCSSGPSAIAPPSIDADDAGEQAMKLYDKDGDGFVAGAELDQAPSLKAAMATLDTNNDGKVAADEVAERVRVWEGTGTGISSITCLVTLNGKPLTGAMVTFEPEPFLGEELKTAVGETNAIGVASPSIPKENRVPADAPPGLHLGLFKVHISKQEGGKESIPAKYNAQTTLGQQVSPDDPAVVARKVRFELTDK